LRWHELNGWINRRSNKRMHATAQRKALINLARGGAWCAALEPPESEAAKLGALTASLVGGLTRRSTGLTASVPVIINHACSPVIASVMRGRGLTIPACEN